MHHKPCGSQALTGSSVGIEALGIYSVSQKKSPPKVFWHFFHNACKILVQILHTYYTFLSTLDYKFLFNYLQPWRSYAILSATVILLSASVHYL